MSHRLEPLTRLTLPDAPPVSVDCVFWQSSGLRSTPKSRSAERVEEDWGGWGTLYRSADGRLLGLLQFGPSGIYPRAFGLPAGPPSPDAMLVTCAYLVDETAPWVMQSLFLAAIDEAKDRRVRAIEAFGYRYAEGKGTLERMRAHRTIFPADFLGDLGFFTVRAEGRVELGRLELGGSNMIEADGVAQRVLRRARDKLQPDPVPQRP